jgi:hypothetical protein
MTSIAVTTIISTAIVVAAAIAATIASWRGESISRA